MAQFNERLRQLRRDRGLSQQELADQLRLIDSYSRGLSKSSINMYERGEREPGFETLETIADYFNVDMDYLLGRSDTGPSANLSNILPIPSMREVPIVGDIACGQPILAVENAEETAFVPDAVRADFCLRCKGDSMRDARILDGDLVFIRRQPQVENGQIAAVRIGEEATLKKVYLHPDRVVLRACNPLYADLVYEGTDLEDVEVLGLAVAFTSAVKHD